MRSGKTSIIQRNVATVSAIVFIVLAATACGGTSVQSQQNPKGNTGNNTALQVNPSAAARTSAEIKTLESLNTTYRATTNIAIMDSGVDTQHSSLINQVWSNPREIANSLDDDDNGYIDDIYGWNFVDGNNQPIDRNMLTTFSADVYKFVEISSKKVRGTATPDEINWANNKRQDQSFLSQVNTFGTYVHGTHVAGIASANSPNTKIITEKLIQPQSYTLAGGISVNSGSGSSFGLDSLLGPILNSFLSFFLGGGGNTGGGNNGGASGAGYDMHPMFEYARSAQVLVANCSFGINRTNIASLIQRNRMSSTSFSSSNFSTNSITDSYIQYLNTQFANDFRTSSNVLFVIAAGNDSTNNDSTPQAPANARADNMLSVAATLNNDSLASFSNFGATTVDIAAPGVAINSTIPGNREIEMSGTSMAAPYVTNIAARIRSVNPNLTAVQTKQILMQTVDVKPFLQGKVISSGIVNPERALTAAEYSTSMTLDAAVAQAKTAFPNPSTILSMRTSGISARVADSGFVVPMPGQ